MPARMHTRVFSGPELPGTLTWTERRGNLPSPGPRNIRPIRGIAGGIAMLGILTALSAGCGKKVPSESGKESRISPVPKNERTRVVEPAGEGLFTTGDRIPVKLETTADTLPGIDSVEIYMGGVRRHVLLHEPLAYACPSDELPVGNRSLRIVCYFADGGKESHSLNLVLKSDIVPGYLKYRILNTWPHDPQAYTQGLVYEGGFLYEGTGQWSESSLRKTVISTGEPVRVLNLPDDIFGEGITLLNDKIYQLTYKSQVGFVYEKESFRRIQKVYYQIKEGWGLTHDGQHLIMSDGSHILYFMDPEYFTEVRQLEVFDDKGPVRRLNELEYIGGRIFANLYGEEVIVIIDPEKGKVTGKLDMKGILPEKDRQSGTDVFNGIAWNPEKRVMYVTGKNWPKLFEVSLEGEF